MINIINNSNSPFYNLALEEYVFKNFHDDKDYFILWINEPTVVIGRYQNTLQEINEKYIKENNINVVRRMTGGGAVYHDFGNLNFSFITTGDNEVKANFAKYTKPIIQALAEIGVTAELTGRNDLTIDGKKFSGNAQSYYKNRILHHGTILFNSDLSVVQETLRVKEAKLTSKGVKSVRSRVTNVIDYLKTPTSITDFKDELAKYLQAIGSDNYTYQFNAEELAGIQKLYEEKYMTWDWNYGQNPAFTIKFEKRFPGGTIEFLIFDVKNGLIQDCKVFGDFFGKDNINEFEKLFVGQKYDVDNLKEIVAKCNVDKYFTTLSTEDLLTLFD